jgi:radical SAM superfamily enzyme YgiQ (UPF0313 family)
VRYHVDVASNSLHARVRNDLLPYVQQPGQYIGGELNQLVRPGQWEAAEVKVAIAFPDTYTIGMSHLGCQILYWLCNHTPGICAERVYSPWLDAERVMRARGIPLFTWDTRQPVASADILAISLQYELCFTTVLNLLDLAGIPLRSEERMNTRRGPVSARSFARGACPGTEVCLETGPLPVAGPHAAEWPLVIAGGPQADNPEPMAEFVDLVVMGDGEHSLAALLEAYREYQRAGVPRRDMILLMARRFPWVYAPNLYQPSYHDDGTLAELPPRHTGLPARIERCKTPDFEDAPFPTRPLVPWTEVVHDRISIEVMRGCPQICRFCHAGYTKRPLHLRTVDRILQIAEEAYWATGQHEIGLLSLSTADYPHLRELADKANAAFGPRMVNLSFPSLRVDKMLANIPWMGNAVRKGSLTVAVEAANDDMRKAIRKKVTDGNLLEGVRQAYQAGWNRVKLYFMAGFPGERPEDIDGIWRLANAVAQERRSIGKGPAAVTASVGWLVPKPFTPLQWMAQPPAEYFVEVREHLRALQRGGADRAARRSGNSVREPHAATDGAASTRRALSGPAGYAAAPIRGRKSTVKITTPEVEASILEGVMARGDRKLCRVIHEAWKRGARLDGWTECFRNDIWREAFQACGIDPAWYAHRERTLDELLPWDHIGLRMSRDFLERGYDDMFKQVGAARPTAHALPVLSR